MKQNSHAMRLKAQINKFAKEHSIPAQVVLQNVMFERFLNRLSVSDYQAKFVIKGGVLISSVVGIATRTTMDLDTTLRNFPLSENDVLQAIVKICSIDLKDNIIFSDVTLVPIRKDDVYGGFRVQFVANFYAMHTPLSIDVTTGDAITPSPVEYDYYCVLDRSSSFRLWAYNLETVLAEKTETILSRVSGNTRPRDFYDVFILTKNREIRNDVFVAALLATTAHRGSRHIINDIDKRLTEICESQMLIAQWNKYKTIFPYARNISYSEITCSLQQLLEPLL